MTPPTAAHRKTTSSWGRENVIFAAVVAILAIWIFRRYWVTIENFFYDTGIYFLDAGWYAYLVSKFEFPLANPQTFIDSGIETYFEIHLALIMPIWGLVAEFFGLNHPQAFAAYQGTLHAGLFLAGVVMAGLLAPGLRRWIGVMIGATLAFSPIMLSAITFPHTEMATPVLIITTILLLGHSRYGWALLSFALCVSVRGDAGFHLFSFLAVFAALEFVQERKLTQAIRVSAGVAAAGLIYSILAYTLQNVLFPGFDTFSTVYAGDNFSHLTPQALVGRIYIVAVERPEFFALFAIPLVAAVLNRRLSDLAPIFAVTPWFAVNLSAIAGPPSQLFTYYAFPVLVLQAWPFLSVALRRIGTPGTPPHPP